MNMTPWTLRTHLQPGDLGTIVRMHGLLHAQELGFDATFEAYVAAPLADFVRQPSPRQRLWLAERQDQIVGVIAIVPTSDQDTAQLRWFLVDPSVRRQGLGASLLTAALAFARDQQYRACILYTVSGLTAAARLYRAAGFRKVAEHPARLWGVDVVEEKHLLEFP